MEEDVGDGYIVFEFRISLNARRLQAMRLQLSSEFASGHEEVNTTLIALAQAANVNPGEAIMVRWPSGDRVSLLSSWS